MADFYVRDDNGQFQPVNAVVAGIYRSTAIKGFWLKTEWLWAQPAPSLLEVLRPWN